MDMDTLKDKIKLYVIIYSFIIMMIFLLHLVLSPTTAECIRTIKIFYIVDYWLIVIIELMFYVIRGFFAFLGGIKPHYWLFILSIPLTMLAIAYDAVLVFVYHKSVYYGGHPYKDVIVSFREGPKKFYDLQQKWQCCSLTGPYDEIASFPGFMKHCCPVTGGKDDKTCIPVIAFQNGCIAMSYLIYFAGIGAIILLIFDVSALIATLIVAKDLKDSDDDDED